MASQTIPQMTRPYAGYRRLDLARSRQQRGISLEEIAQSTKISLRFLRAIEDEEFEKLPGGIFATSYLRQYAAASGFAGEELLACYDAWRGPDEEVSEPLARKPHPEQRSLLGRLLHELR